MVHFQSQINPWGEIVITKLKKVYRHLNWNQNCYLYENMGIISDYINESL